MPSHILSEQGQARRRLCSGVVACVQLLSSTRGVWPVSSSLALWGPAQPCLPCQVSRTACVKVACVSVCIATRLQQLVSCIKPNQTIMATTWLCVATGSNVAQCPSAVAKAFQRGHTFQAAAWQQLSSDKFKLYFAVESSKSPQKVRQDFHKLLNTHNGTIGQKLPGASVQVEEVKRIDRSPFGEILSGKPQCTILRDFQASAAAAALVPASPRSMPNAEEEAQRARAFLGLESGATLDEAKAAYRKLVLACHPDKAGPEYKGMFIAVHHAFEQLRATLGGEEKDPVEAILVPQMAELTIESHQDAVKKEQERLLAYKDQLEAELKKVKAQLSRVGGISVAQARSQARAAAVSFTLQFRKSAAFWDKVELARWFQLDRHDYKLTHTAAGFEALDAKYGPHLRQGNEDLDPFMHYERWWPQWDNRTQLPNSGGAKVIQVRVGLDAQDAAENGHVLILPLRALSHKQHLDRLALLGFTVQDADAVLGGTVPAEGYSMDVRGERLRRGF